MDQLGIKESDISESFILGSGKGGQKQNNTHNCVRLKHKPTGLTVTCQKGRERALNRFLARRKLCDLLCTSRGTDHLLKIEKIKKQKKRRKRRHNAQ